MSQAIPSTPAYLDTVTKRALSRIFMNIDCVRSVIVELDSRFLNALSNLHVINIIGSAAAPAVHASDLSMNQAEI